ncbi:MAG: pentapeptide repeat-containing protein [candidate division Zixibacteria bacterium]|nr:pentapeptide repeat-containing protein [candidate division Zixibacteria bacterium]
MPHVLILCTYFYAYKHNPIFSYATAQFTVIGLIATIWFRFEFEPSVKAQGYIKNLNIYQIVIIVILALVFIYSFLVIFVNKSFTLDIHPLNDFNWLPQKEVIFILCINSFLLSAYLVVWCIIFLDRLNRFSTKFFDKLLTGELIVYQSQYLLYAFILLWFSYFNYEGTYFLFNVNIQNQILVTKPAVEHENVYWIDLKDAHLEAANLSGSVLNHADLRNAHFDWAKLNYTDLSNCNLEGVNFKEASLKGADLRGAKGLTAKQLSQAYTLQGVELDGGLRSYFKESSYYLLLNPGNPNFSIKRYPFYEPIGERKISFINDKP